MNNPTNIENDLILTHGRWCADKCLHPANEQRIQSIMDQRRADLIANRVAYCEGATL